MKRCVNCGFESEDSDARFCMKCGGAMEEAVPEHKCPACGFEADEDAAFCKKCGTKIQGAAKAEPVNAAESAATVVEPAPRSAKRPVLERTRETLAKSKWLWIRPVFVMALALTLLLVTLLGGYRFSLPIGEMFGTGVYPLASNSLDNRGEDTSNLLGSERSMEISQTMFQGMDAAFSVFMSEKDAQKYLTEQSQKLQNLYVKMLKEIANGGDLSRMTQKLLSEFNFAKIQYLGTRFDAEQTSATQAQKDLYTSVAISAWVYFAAAVCSVAMCVAALVYLILALVALVNKKDFKSDTAFIKLMTALLLGTIFLTAVAPLVSYGGTMIAQIVLILVAVALTYVFNLFAGRAGVNVLGLVKNSVLIGLALTCFLLFCGNSMSAVYNELKLGYVTQGSLLYNLILCLSWQIYPISWFLGAFGVIPLFLGGLFLSFLLVPTIGAMLEGKYERKNTLNIVFTMCMFVLYIVLTIILSLVDEIFTCYAAPNLYIGLVLTIGMLVVQLIMKEKKKQIA